MSYIWKDNNGSHFKFKATCRRLRLSGILRIAYDICAFLGNTFHTYHREVETSHVLAQSTKRPFEY